MNSLVPSLLRRWLILLMVGLLGLGPFLHSHFGASHDTGFHLDGVHAVHAAGEADPGTLLASEEESPALGVSASLPQPEDDRPSDPLLALWLVVPLRPALVPAALPRSERIPSLHQAIYRKGLPPPALAPPIA